MTFLLLLSLKTFIIESKTVFPVLLKQADIKPIFEKDSRNEKENYRPVSILPKHLACIHRWTSTLTLFYLSTNLNLEKDIVLGNVYLLWLKNKELLYIRIELVQRFWQIHLKLMIAYYIIYYLLNYYFHIVQLCGYFTAKNLITSLTDFMEGPYE